MNLRFFITVVCSSLGTFVGCVLGAEPQVDDLLDNSFESYLNVNAPVADGFDLPWNENKRMWIAIGHGRVLSIERNVGSGSYQITIEHVCYQNHHRFGVQSVYGASAEPLVIEGQDVSKGQAIAQRKKRASLQDFNLCLGMKAPCTRKPFKDSTEFIYGHHRLFVPQKEKELVLIDASLHRMRHYRHQVLVGEYEIGIGQDVGRKRKRGDLRTPYGMYFIVEKSRGYFDGPYGKYNGGYWLRLNYPNRFDAGWGFAHGLVSKAASELITKKWRRRKKTLSNSSLGGGIGIHGWREEWSNENTRLLSWGCVVMHNQDIESIFDQKLLGTMVVILGE